jgi:hypothetical protein
VKIQSLTRNELLDLRDKLIKQIASAADRVSLIDRQLDVIRSNELESDLIQSESAGA